jgi:molybdopterin converting factor small subunit
MRLLRMKPGHGEVLLAEGNVEVSEELELLVAEFRVAQLVKSFDEVPRDADRVIFFPRAAGGR